MPDPQRILALWTLHKKTLEGIMFEACVQVDVALGWQFEDQTPACSGEEASCLWAFLCGMQSGIDILATEQTNVEEAGGVVLQQQGLLAMRQNVIASFLAGMDKAMKRDLHVLQSPH